MSRDLVHALLQSPADGSVASATALREHSAGAPSEPFDRAVLGGLASAGVGWAFACGYEAALARLDPGSAGALTAMCATESGGGHPRAIRASLVPASGGGWSLTGRKTWVTLGADAERLLVVASTGADEAGRNRLRVARVPSARAGVRLEPGTPTPFAPEIRHAVAILEGVAVAESEVLAGDGYEVFLKPFRTIEDVHVTAAILGWAIGVARGSGWDRGWIEEAVAGTLALRAVAASEPSRPETHVVLAGAMAWAKRVLDGGAWNRANDAVRAGWERDRPLLDVASVVRGARLEAAWRALGAANE
jgi:acyl-CoA dehydrogenase